MVERFIRKAKKNLKNLAKFDWRRFFGENKFNLTLVLLSIFGGFFAFFLSLGQEVWFDEAYSIWITKGKNFQEIISSTSVDAHPPLYYFLLKIWGDLGGWNIAWLRILSIVCFSISIFLAGKIIERNFSEQNGKIRKIAIFSAGLLIFLPFLLRYAYEIRMYSLASLISILSTFLLFEICRKPKSRKAWIFYGISVAAGMYTLYTLVLVFLSQFLLAAFWRICKKSWKFWREGWCKAYALAVFLWLPWLKTALFQLKNPVDAGIGEFFSSDFLRKIVNFAIFYKPNSEISIKITIIVSVVLAIVLAFWLIKNPQARKNELFVLAFLPFAFTIILSLRTVVSKPFFVERYMSQFVILAYLCVAFAVSEMILGKMRIFSLLAGVVVVLNLIGVLNLYHTGNYNYQRNYFSRAGSNMSKISQICNGKMILTDDAYLFSEYKIYDEKCGLKFFTDFDGHLTGGWNILDDIPERIGSLEGIDEFYAIIDTKYTPNFERFGFQYVENGNLPQLDYAKIYHFKRN